MNTIKRIFASGLLGLVGLIGCDQYNNPETNKPETNKPERDKYPTYFASIPSGETGTAMTSGDFDGDGDLDLIVSASTLHQHLNDYRITKEAKLYLFFNDGKGNFTQAQR